MVAGIIVKLTGSQIADPLVSLIIAGFLLWSSWAILKEATEILLESSPERLDMPAVEKSIQQTLGVLGVHDLHVWTIASGMLACSCHILVAEQTVRQGQQVLRAVIHELADKDKIGHRTIQVEVEGCEADEMYCTLHAKDEHSAG